MKILIAFYCVLQLVFNFCEGLSSNDSTMPSIQEETTTVRPPTITTIDDSRVTTDPVDQNVDMVKESNGTVVVVVNRTAHARMSSLEELFRRRPTTTTTTQLPATEYDYWWYFTTPRRPRFSYRDFPGKPGVATWKEISPAIVKETKKNRKSEPTAEGVQAAGSTSQISSAIVLVTSFLLRHYYLFTITF